MYIRDGFTAEEVIQGLRALIQQADNIHGLIGQQRAKTEYLNWLGGAERSLRNMFVDGAIADALLTERLWRIDRDYSNPPTQGINLGLRAELEMQASRLSALADGLAHLATLSQRPGYQTILDTNVYLHCTMFTEVDWRTELGKEAVRIILPAAILRELDQIKINDRGPRRERACRSSRRWTPCSLPLNPPA
ncbi:PIN domain-containing protein [Actinomadura scrupuli]|uniref:PIN domain-containing protein n=1 Tax=Actinomadura scrupuli TaxID=559629 RepID=UPI003D96B227